MYLLPSPSFTYTNTFLRPPLSTTYVSPRSSPLPQAESDVVLITGLSGGVPSKRTLPVIVPAVAASTLVAPGAALGDAGWADLLWSPPLHAAIAAATATHANAL